MDRFDRVAALRATLALMLAQSLSAAAYTTATTITQLAAVSLSGQKALAGLPGTFVLIGSALAAYPAGRIMGRIGRRYGLTLGAVLGAAGAAIGGVGIVRGSLLAFIWGLFVLGMGRGTLEQSRYAVAELHVKSNRARAMSYVIWGATVGAVIGPLLTAPAGNWALSMGLNTYSGPLFVTAALYIVAAAVLFGLLAVNLRAIAEHVARADAQDAVEVVAPTQARSFRDALRAPAVFAALVAMACGQAAMALMMSSISIHMNDHNHGLGDISAVISAHVLGMFAFSPLVGQLADRLGRRAAIALGATVLAIGCVIAPLSLNTPAIALALFLVGLGWSGCYVGGSALLTDALGVSERARLQGANDTVVSIASATGSLGSGILLAAVGFTALSGVGLAVALLPLLAALFVRPSAVRPAMTSIEK
jgi:MFS family permease